MITSTIAVTGSKGYLGSAVTKALAERNYVHAIVAERLERLRPGALNCQAVLHCAGRLRGHGAQRIWADNVTTTATLLRAVRSNTVIVLASSRAVDSAVPDQYSRSKQAAEQLVAAHPGPTCVLRLTVLAGPSPGGLGRSFLSRMTAHAIRDRTITVPQHTRPVDLLDVREAAAVLAAVSVAPDRRRMTLHATAGPVDLFGLAELVADTVYAVTRQRTQLVRAAMPANHSPSPASPAAWRDLCTRHGVHPIPLEITVRDAVEAHVAALEAGRVGP
ncbi:NAD-dependent epimerase/dehydratase family protein [Saccharothrix sp. Mg75]|uniref:NAD-dependent epimerase/dehydratase family protein n=1 Tax=Saccharothrix sp. Mg75 TaxID=3445357 RepID=UPI003EEC7689